MLPSGSFELEPSNVTSSLTKAGDDDVKAGTGAPETLTVPRMMSGCTLQWKAKLPECVNVCERLTPSGWLKFGLGLPGSVSKGSSTLSFDAGEWLVSGPTHFQSTVSPGAMLTVVGLNVLLLPVAIVTVAAPAVDVIKSVTQAVTSSGMRRSGVMTPDSGPPHCAMERQIAPAQERNRADPLAHFAERDRATPPRYC